MERRKKTCAFQDQMTCACGYRKMSSKLSLLFYLPIISLFMILGPTVAPASDGGLLREATGFKSRSPHPWVERSRDVFVDFALLEGAAASAEKNLSGRVFLDLEFFDDIRLAASLDRIERDDRGAWILSGKVSGHEDSQVVLVARQGVLVGSARTAGEFFSIRYAGGGVHVVEQIDEQSMPPEAPPQPVVSRGDAHAGEKLGLAATGDDGTILDLLVVYTPEARAAAGGTIGIENSILLGLSETNLAMANSGVVPRFRLVHTAELAGYAETGTILDQLDPLVETSDGIADEVHQLRDLHRADFVKLVVKSGGTIGSASLCGVAKLMDGTAAFESQAFSITVLSCISGNATFGHELGHSMGCNHAPEDPTGTGARPFSFGYKDPQKRFRTIMAYPCRDDARKIPTPSDCPSVLNFSNPDVLVEPGLPTGTEDQNNARSINEVRTILANFRDSDPMPEIAVRRLPQNVEVFDDGRFAFETTRIDQLPVDQRIEICNQGAANLAIGNPSSLVSGTAFSQIGTVEASVAPGACTEFRARFETTSAQIHYGSITIQNNDSNEDPFDIAISGRAIEPAPEIRVRHAADGQTIHPGQVFDFPATPLGDLPISRLFEICNDGESDLAIDNPSSLVSGLAFFQIGDEPSAVVAPSACTAFRVRFQAAAAGDFSGTVSIQNNDPDDGPFTFTVEGRASDAEIRVHHAGAGIADGGFFDFPRTPVDELPISRLFEICNDGDLNLVIDNGTSLVSGPGFLQIGDQPSPVVAPGSCTSFRVRFQVGTAGDYSGTVAIQNNDRDEDPFSFTVQGTAASSDAEIRVHHAGATIADGGSFLFPTTPVEDLPVSRLFWICNDGDMDLHIDNAANLVAGSGFQQIDTPPPGAVAPYTCASFRVRFDVASEGTFAGAITIRNNDSDEDPYDISLGGTATGPEPEIRVELSSAGTEMLDGGAFQFPATPVASLPISRLFKICNDGPGNLVISNPSGLVSGSAFTQIGDTPASTVASGTCTEFRVRFDVSGAGSYSGTVTIQNNDVDEGPFNFSLGGTATE